MCGIFGAAFAEEINPERLELLRAGTASLTHRGPDHGGEAVLDKVYLGHRRLSIIDLSAAANQPLHAKTEPVSLIFNGEIYNFHELLEHLPGFESRSDSETLLEGYIRFGKSFFEKLRGIYAFAILDRRRTHRMILVRDPAGIKPLYVHLSSKKNVFGSEIKALCSLLKTELTIDERVLKAYLHLGYCPEPHTIYRDIRCVRPGYFLDVNLATFESVEKPFLDYDFTWRKSGTLLQNTEATAQHLATAVARNLVADVPVTLSLSSGIDSSLIFAQANRGQASRGGLSVRFSDSEYDESKVAAAFAEHLGAPLDLISANVTGALDLLEKVFLHFDQPYADSSALPFYFLAKAARQRGKVLIGGDGGDEVHEGYLGHGVFPRVWRLSHPPVLNRIANAGLAGMFGLTRGSRARKIRRLAGVVAKQHPMDRLFEWTAWLPTSTRFEGRSPFLYDPQDTLDFCREDLPSPGAASADQWARQFYFQQRMRSDYLRKSDMMSMIHGLEYRVPMLDEDLVTHGLSLPFRQKSGWRQQKQILRQLHRQIYPPELSQRPKTGFTIPLDTWLGETGLEGIKSMLVKKSAFPNQWIDPAYVRQLFDSKTVASGQLSRAARYQRILIFYNLENWYRKTYAAR